MVWLAYDGSLNGDWIFRYALRFAAQEDERSLILLHVDDGQVASAALRDKLERLETACLEESVQLQPQFLPLGRGVLPTLLAALPSGHEHLLVCGARLRPRHRFYLRGTIAEGLLRARRLPVLALRVVQPGLCGQAHDFLLPLAGHPQGFARAWPFFRYFLPDVRSLYLLRGMAVSTVRLPYLSPQGARAQISAGEAYLDAVRREVLGQHHDQPFHLDSGVTLCADWAHEVLLHASRLKAQMLLLGATGKRLRPPWRRDPLERVIAASPCDVGVYLGP